MKYNIRKLKDNKWVVKGRKNKIFINTINIDKNIVQLDAYLLSLNYHNEQVEIIQDILIKLYPDKYNNESFLDIE